MSNQQDLKKCIYFQFVQYKLNQQAKMSESDSRSRQIQQEEFSPELSNIPQTMNNDERPNDNLNSYIRIEGRQEKIDEQGILQEFHSRRRQQDYNRNSRNPIFIGKKSKPQKVPEAPSKKYDFGYLKRKWKTDIDSNIEKYKQYLKEEKQGYDFKEKQFMLDFFKILLDGIFELKDYSDSEFNDLTNNEQKIIAEESDIFAWLKDIVSNFDREFKEAKYNQKIMSTGNKWIPLIKNCRDENNFQLRRKIIRCKIKPIHVIENSDAFLMSEQAKLEEERQKKLILAQADKNFQKPLEQEQEVRQRSYEDGQMSGFPQQLQCLKSISFNENQEKKIRQQKQKVEEYKQFIQFQLQQILKKRIQQVLNGTPCYETIMNHFVQTFQSN